jgi:ribosomal-protein-alanine N-acetyltransferase
MPPPPRTPILTRRLTLRPSNAGDAARAFEIRADPAVSRMLSLARFPPSRDEIETWFSHHPEEWADGLAYRFAILLDGRMIGLVDLDDITPDGAEAEIGVWLEQARWGAGYGEEAVRALVAFAFGPLGLSRLRAGCAEDNAASRAIIEDLGFRYVGDVAAPSLSRGEDVVQRRYRLEPPIN